MAISWAIKLRFRVVTQLAKGCTAKQGRERTHVRLLVGTRHAVLIVSLETYLRQKPVSQLCYVLPS